jgi:hypothetical protein
MLLPCPCSITGLHIVLEQYCHPAFVTSFRHIVIHRTVCCSYLHTPSSPPGLVAVVAVATYTLLHVLVSMPVAAGACAVGMHDLSPVHVIEKCISFMPGVTLTTHPHLVPRS